MFGSILSLFIIQRALETALLLFDISSTAFITNLNKMKLAHGRNLIIWLSFCRAGILVILCHIFRCVSIS